MVLSPCRSERERERERECRWVLGLKRPVKLAGSGFLKMMRKKLMVWPWCGSEFGILRKKNKKKMNQFETWCKFFCERHNVSSFVRESSGKG